MPKLPPRMAKPDKYSYEQSINELNNEIESIKMQRSKILKTIKARQSGGSGFRDEKDKARKIMGADAVIRLLASANSFSAFSALALMRSNSDNPLSTVAFSSNSFRRLCSSTFLSALPSSRTTPPRLIISVWRSLTVNFEGSNPSSSPLPGVTLGSARLRLCALVPELILIFRVVPRLS